MKLVIDEPGTEDAAGLWDGATANVANRVVYPEARAALAAAHRGGRIDASGLRSAVDAVDDYVAGLGVIDLDERLARAAGELAEAHRLRGYDAVHLASALSVDRDLVFATWDRNLAAAGLAAGCAVFPPVVRG